MKRTIITGVLIAIAIFLTIKVAQADGSKLWVSKQGVVPGLGFSSDENAQMYFMQDKETGTRCYAVVTSSGSAISCVPDSHWYVGAK